MTTKRKTIGWAVRDGGIGGSGQHATLNLIEGTKCGVNGTHWAMRGYWIGTRKEAERHARRLRDEGLPSAVAVVVRKD